MIKNIAQFTTAYDRYEIEDNPFEPFVPANATYLIIGTFPAHKINLQFDFFYSCKDNLFWEVLSRVLNHRLSYSRGTEAVEERKSLLEKYGFAIADMHLKCYRKNKSSFDENLFLITLTDIFKILTDHPSITTLVLTSREEVFGALGLFKTLAIQHGMKINEPAKREDKILEGEFVFQERKYKLFVPYSTSARLIRDETTNINQLVQMYKYCLTH